MDVLSPTGAVWEDSNGEAAAEAPPDVGSVCKRYRSELADFFATFEQLVHRACTTCKPNAIGYRSSRDRIKQRADRQALCMAHARLSEIYRDAAAHVERSSGSVPRFAASTLRLHLLLSRLLSEEDTSSAAPSASDKKLSSVDTSPEAPRTLVLDDEAAALDAMRAELCRKPTGTVASVVRELRVALAPAASTQLLLVYRTLLAAAAATAPSTGAALSAIAPSGGEADGRGTSVGAATAATAAALQEELELARHQAEAASDYAREAERLVHEQAGLRSEAEQQAAVLATRVAQLEAALQRASDATTDAQAIHTAAAHANAAREAAAAAAALTAAREAEQVSRSELNALREEFRERSDLLRELQERLELATALGTQSAAAEAAIREHAERLGETVATLEQQCAKLDAGHRALVQRAAMCAMLEQQAARRALELGQLGATVAAHPGHPAPQHGQPPPLQHQPGQTPMQPQQPGQQPPQPPPPPPPPQQQQPQPYGGFAGAPQAPAVPLAMQREMQLELAMVHERLAQLQGMHASNIQELEHAKRELHASAAHSRELGRKLYLAEQQLLRMRQLPVRRPGSAATQVQPLAQLPLGEAHEQRLPWQLGPSLQGDATASNTGAVQPMPSTSAISENLSTIAGSLLATLNKKVKQATSSTLELSKGLVDDIKGLTGAQPAQTLAAAAQREAPTGGGVA